MSKQFSGASRRSFVKTAVGAGLCAATAPDHFAKVVRSRFRQ